MTNTQTEQTDTEKRAELFEHAGLSLDCEFVPFTRSKHCVDKSASWLKKPNWPSINWDCVLRANGRTVLHTDYAQGIGHIPGYNSSAPLSVFAAGVIAEAIQTGRVDGHRHPQIAKPGMLLPPSLEDVMYSLLLDGSPDFDAMSFDDWCGDYGYDTDSRKAEQTYKQCLEIGQQLRGALGGDVIDQLREAYKDY